MKLNPLSTTNRVNMSGKLFTKTAFEDDIYRSMEKQLVANQVEDTRGLKKLARAADYLHAAASIFDQAGMSEEADAVTEVLQGLAGQDD